MNFMAEAVKEAYEGTNNNEGGPFGSVVVKDEKIVGRGHNRVIKKHDPTCHGEVEAIRDACQNLGTHDLTGCIIYTTSEPCPMCLGAILWANIDKVYFGCDRKDANEIGFRDEVFYDKFYNRTSPMPMEEDGKEECKKLFEDYVKDTKNERY